MRPTRALVCAALLMAPATAAAQDWNSDEVLALIGRSIQRRIEVRTDSGLRDYRARAHGFVFFLAQLGELSEPPRLVKSDQLELEVYWRSPGRIKQRIVGWRDKADLPTDIRYHRDHLGIVANNFGDRIGLGHEEEVRNVPHPLAPDGLELYDYVLLDSLTMRLPQRSVRVYRVRTRPKDLGSDGVIGTLFIDVDEAELVIFRFNFTRNSYVDETLEDITIVLENSLWDGTYWLPHRQEIEIRRRSSWLDLPARGIIRGRWEIDSYEFNVGTSESVFRGAEIVAASQQERDQFPWQQSLEAEVREITDPALNLDVEAVRAEVRRFTDDRVLTGLATAQASATRVSELLRFNRVEGLALGFGAIARPGGGVAELRGLLSYGISDQEVKARLAAERRIGRFTIGLNAYRQIEDVADELVISQALNSITAQEVGRDYGDYSLASGARATLGLELGARGQLKLGFGLDHSISVPIVASPATGTFRENPDLGVGTLGLATLRIERRSAGITVGRGASGQIAVEGGTGAGIRYVRVHGAGQLRTPLGGTDLIARAWAGWGSPELPARRSFVLGGRGDLVSDPFRSWGGRYGAFGVLEWRLPVPFPAVPLGTMVSTGDRIFVLPFVGVGGAGGTANGDVPWVPSDGLVGVVGLGVEWFHNLFRTDVAVSLRDPRVGLIIDVNRALWSIL